MRKLNNLSFAAIGIRGLCYNSTREAIAKLTLAIKKVIKPES